ncbi:restriction endonuclease subunit S [Ligilactobacillus salivarius]|nr:restriction endonuclease subunit S [Ligilactobacillus salivarius]WHS06737.1 restriction endonuclease subunit S [Ligilactobacillus salivarius]
MSIRVYPKQLALAKYENVKVEYPDVKEQDHISKLFFSLDNTLQLHERKCEELALIKKALLQKLFPKKDEIKPEVRYKNFSDAWEQRKLGEVVERFDNLRIPVTSSKREKGITPYYGANGIQDYVQGYTHDGEFVLVAEDGANDLQNYPVHYVNGKVWVNNHAHVLQGKNKMVDNLFLVNAIKQIKIETYLVGGSRAKLNADVMMKLPIKVPTFNEQQKIGEYFSKFDTLITLHQRKLEKLKQLKKFLLQNMFI